MTFLEKSLDNLSDNDLDSVAGGDASTSDDTMWCPGCSKYIPTSKVVNHVCTICGHTFGSGETY